MGAKSEPNESTETSGCKPRRLRLRRFRKNFEEILTLPEQTAAKWPRHFAVQRGKNSKKWQRHFYDDQNEAAEKRLLLRKPQPHKDDNGYPFS